VDQPNENRENEHGRGRGYLPPWVAPDEIKALRRRLRVTQREFAGWFGFSVATLRHWERGNRHPTGAALVLLSVIRENPRVVLQAVRKARCWSPGSLPKIEPLDSYRAPPMQRAQRD
jgi:putative transcriptional regulator